ncbi:MAG TPA: diguanylate cyclase, partial [Candidatus Nitrosotenuis sp.]|nr:diguanylate cyclase [Candidatus Nitrosotenuis sp.]
SPPVPPPTAPGKPSLTSIPAPTRASEPPPAAPPPAPPAATGQSLEELGIDPVTQFCYQETFELLLADEIEGAARRSEECCLLYFYIDNLAELKERDAGAAARLRADIASLVSTFLRPGVDIPGLVGEDDFAVVMPRTGIEIGANVAEQIRFTVSNLSVAGQSVSMSVGVAAFPGAASDAAELCERAMQAAEQAVLEGGGRVSVYGLSTGQVQ